MKAKITIISFLYLLSSCYYPDDDFTALKNIELRLINIGSKIIADGTSKYSFEVKFPGVRNGEAKAISLVSTWGLWINDSSSITLPITYNLKADAYIDTISLTASTKAGPFAINLYENMEPRLALELSAAPNFPSDVQILADSLVLRLIPGSTTELKALFFNDTGFTSDGTKFKFITQAEVQIFPKVTIVESSRSVATLQVLTNTVQDTIEIYGLFPDLKTNQPNTDTLKIAIIKD